MGLREELRDVSNHNCNAMADAETIAIEGAMTALRFVLKERSFWSNDVNERMEIIDRYIVHEESVRALLAQLEAKGNG